VCVVRDDGCTPSPGAFDWLRLRELAPDDAFKLTIARQKIAIKTLNDKTPSSSRFRVVELELPRSEPPKF